MNADYVHTLRLIDTGLPEPTETPAAVVMATAFDQDPVPEDGSLRFVNLATDQHGTLVATIEAPAAQVVIDYAEQTCSVYGRPVLALTNDDGSKPAIRHRPLKRKVEIDMFIAGIDCAKE